MLPLNITVAGLPVRERCSGEDLNLRHLAYQASALTGLSYRCKAEPRSAGGVWSQVGTMVRGGAAGTVCSDPSPAGELPGLHEGPVIAAPALSLPARRSPRRWAVLAAGVVLLGVGVGLLVAAGWGTGSWQVLDTGIARATGWSVGQASLAANAVTLLAAWALGRRPTPATVAVWLGVGPVIDLTLNLVAPGGSVVVRAVVFTVGTAAIAVGIAAMVAADVGLGPIDALWVAVMERTGWSVTRTQLTVAVVVTSAGTLLGGMLGLGTLVHTAAVAVTVGRVLPVLQRLAAPPATAAGGDAGGPVVAVAHTSSV